MKYAMIELNLTTFPKIIPITPKSASPKVVPSNPSEPIDKKDSVKREIHVLRCLFHADIYLADY
jgi:hypothetical protein